MLAYQHSGFSVDAGVTTAHPPAPLFLCAGTEFTIQGSGDGAGPGATCATEYEVFPLLCPKCGGQMRLIAFITEAMQIRKILDHIGADSEPPHIALARGSPDGETYVMESALLPDVSLVKAWRADQSGNLQFRLTARNFNPAVAMAGKVCIVEVEEVVETGAMEPDQVHLPGIYVHRIVCNPNPEKRIEKRTITDKPVEKAGS